MKASIPTLSSQGVITDPKRAMLYLFKSFGKIGGLLYPIEKSFKENKNICHSETWFGNTNTKFIIDGIDLSNLEESNENKFAPISKREQKFINGIKKLLK